MQTQIKFVTTIRFECYGMVVAIARPTIHTPWKKKLVSSVRGMDSVPAAYGFETRAQAWAHAVELYNRFSCGGCDELQDEDGRIHACTA